MAEVTVHAGGVINLRWVSMAAFLHADIERTTETRFGASFFDTSSAELHGSEFTYGENRVLRSGTVTGYFAYDEGHRALSIKGFQTEIDNFYQMARTDTLRDDRKFVADWFSEADKMRGNSANDALLGFGGKDRLWGNGGEDGLFGGVGDDKLDGGAKADRLTGGKGADRFMFSDIAHSAIDAEDTIVGFSHRQGDRIDVSKAGNFDWIGNVGFSGDGDAQLRYVIDGDKTIVRGDSDGDGEADFGIVLFGEHALKGSDFLL